MMPARKRASRSRLVVLVGALALLLVACPAADEEVVELPEEEPDEEVDEPEEPAAAVEIEAVTLTAALGFAEGTAFNEGFEIFVEVLDEKSDGAIQVDLLGGPEVIPPFELFEALSDGVVDMANVAAAFYVPQIPVIDGEKLSPMLPWEEREASVFDFYQELHNEQNVQYLGHSSAGIEFAIYVNEPLEEPDFSGLTIRVTPIYAAFVEALGGSTVTTEPGEVYTALERGTVDGYGWPIVGVPDLGWDEVTEYRIDHPFYQVFVNALMNLDTWNGLPEETQNLIMEAMEEAERRLVDHYEQRAEGEVEILEEAGIEFITFDDEQADEYLQAAEDAGWQAVLDADPENGERLRELLDVED